MALAERQTVMISRPADHARWTQTPDLRESKNVGTQMFYNSFMRDLHFRLLENNMIMIIMDVFRQW